MPRILLGFNRLFTIRRPVRAVTASGSSDESFTTIATNVPGTIQAHVLSNLPAPPQRPKAAGQFRMDEFRLWLGDPVNSVNAQLDELSTNKVQFPFRATASWLCWTTPGVTIISTFALKATARKARPGYSKAVSQPNAGR